MAIFCTSCGSRMLDDSQYCQSCGRARYGTPVVLAPEPNRQVVVVPAQKSSGLAVLLSFFWCGLGQIYNGQIIKGLFLMFLEPFLAVVGWAFFIGGLASAGGSSQGAGGGFVLVGFLCWLATAVLWLWQMANAYRTAEKINHEHYRLLQARS